MLSVVFLASAISQILLSSGHLLINELTVVGDGSETTTSTTPFPHLSPSEYQRILTPPDTSASSPSSILRVVVDTDFDNEIDDWFALCWLLSQHKNRLLNSSGFQLNQVRIEAVYIAPYSYESRLEKLLEAYGIWLIPEKERTPEQKDFLKMYEARIEAIVGMNVTRSQLSKNPHLNGRNIGGVEESAESAREVIRLFGLEEEIGVVEGATHFMRAKNESVVSLAALDLVERARTASPNNPLYVVAIGAVTNVVSALLLDPGILPNIVVIWDAGFPTNVLDVPNIALNLDEDVLASQLLFSSGVPLVYVPGFHVSQSLSLSLPELSSWLKPSGAVGALLADRYLKNPLFPFFGIDPAVPGESWIIWDIANVAWLLCPNVAFVPSTLRKAPILTNDLYWEPDGSGHLMREVYELYQNLVWVVFVDEIKLVDVIRGVL